MKQNSVSIVNKRVRITLPEASVSKDQRITDGDYDRILNSEILQKCSTRNISGTRTFCRVRPVSDGMSMIEVDEWAEAQGLLRAHYVDLLAVGSKFQEWQRESPVLVTGSRVRHKGAYFVPVLSKNALGRTLSVRRYHFPCSKKSTFLFVEAE